MRKILLFVMASFYFTGAQATLDLELTQGISAATPIAILPFVDHTNNPDAESLSEVIRLDLKNSGYFDVVSVTGKEAKATELDKINYQFWRDRGVDNLVVGTIEPHIKTKAKVEFSLLDTLLNQHLILKNQFSTQPSAVRQLAHHIADRVFEQITGIKGVFSTRIVYVVVKRSKNKPTEYQLEVADADGYNPVKILKSHEPIMSPAWSPDGKQLTYVSFEREHAQIFKVDVATGHRKLVTGFPGINGAPAWAPDGKSLCVVLSKGDHPHIYHYDLQSKKLKQLTFGPSINTEPSWAIDGKSIIFTSNRGGSPQIYQYAFDNKKISRLSFDGRYNAHASFTPDGKNIILVHREDGMYNIAIQSVRTGIMMNLTHSGQGESPSIAPNGKMILYETQYKGKGVLSVVSTDGRVKMRLPSRDGSVQSPAWSPFYRS